MTSDSNSYYLQLLSDENFREKTRVDKIIYWPTLESIYSH
jgi:hypothetical protein